MAEVLLVALQTLSSSMDASWEHRQSMTRRMAHPLSMAPMTLASCVSFWRWGLFTHLSAPWHPSVNPLNICRHPVLVDNVFVQSWLLRQYLSGLTSDGNDKCSLQQSG